MNGTTLLMGVMMGVMMIGMITAGLVTLHHLLKKKEQQAMMAAIKAEVIPEIEAMTNRMVKNSMDMVLAKSMDITKKMMETY